MPNREGRTNEDKNKVWLRLRGQILLATVLGIWLILGLLDVKRQFQLVIEHDSPIIANARHLAKLVIDMETGQRARYSKRTHLPDI